MDFENIASNIWQAAFDMDLIGTTPEEENETKSAFITALKGIESLSHNNVNANDYAVFMGAMQRIFDN